MRRIGRHGRKKTNKIIILSAFCLLFIITAGYAAFSTNITLHAKGNIKEKSRVIQSWDENSQTDFHSDFYRENIVSATFVDNNNVPDNATESWNVSEDKENGEVMAWVVPNISESSKYDLYIGTKAGVIANEDSGYLFYKFRELKEINFNNNFDTSNAKDMSLMFYLCTSLVELDLSNFDTSNVTNMYAMFCMWDQELQVVPQNNLISIKFGDSFITNNVTNMRSMFGGLYILKELDVSNFNTSNVTTMYHMFMGCGSLTELDVSNFDTSKVTDMDSMFSDLSNITELDISNFDTSNVTSMSYMFTGCSNLTKLNLCSFDTSRVSHMYSMFAETPKIEVINVGPNWTTENADTTLMFYGSKVSSVTTGQCF